MAQVIVRNIEEDVKRKLQGRARRHGHSMEEEVRQLIRQAVLTEPTVTLGLGRRIVARFESSGITEDLPELRGQEVRPAKLR